MIRMVVAKMFWVFELRQISKELDIDKDFEVYGMWVKPELRVQLLPIVN